MLSTTAGLWLAVIASGLYHGANPGMGWPLAVSAALFDKRRGALWSALAALGIGHFIAMLAILLPFSMLSVLVDYQRELRFVAALLVIGMGLWLVITRRHPRFLARIPPSRLALWSFLVALAHGAALMLVPIYLGLNGAGGEGGAKPGVGALMTNAWLALLVASVHTAAMISAGGGLAFAVHRWLGLRFIQRGWFDLELVWALSLIGVGGVSLWSLA